MNPKRRYQACLLALSILLASLPVTGITAPAPVIDNDRQRILNAFDLLQPVQAPAHAQAQAEAQVQAPAPAQAQAPAGAPVQALTEANQPFKFGKVDLDLLAQINLLDQRFEKEGLVYHEAALDAYLSRVGKAVLADKEIENVHWKFRALRDPVPNAFALPNGSIYINTGLLALLEEEGQLASVLAHEVTHVTKRHTYQQNRSIRKKVLAINILNTIGTWSPVGGSAGLAIDLIATISPLMLALSVFGYSRELEKEADLEGLKKVSAAGYAPDQMVKVIKLLQMDIEGEQLNTFYSDHPKLQDRVTYISNSINSSSNKPSDQQLPDARTQYLTQMENADQHDVGLAINNGRFRSALYVSNKMLTFIPTLLKTFFTWRNPTARLVRALLR